MKSISLYLLLIISITTTTAADNPYQILSKRTDTPITINGKLDEPAWHQAIPVRMINHKSEASAQDSTYLTLAKTCYDDHNLYLAFICHDPDIWSHFTQRDEYLWKQEAVEIFFDADTVLNNYIELQVSPNNVIFDSYIVNPKKIDIPATSQFHLPNLKSAVDVQGTVNQREDTDTKWTIELAIPFTDVKEGLDVSTVRGKEWRINFYRIDRPQTGRTSYIWSLVDGRFHQPEKFGILKFE